MIKTYRACVFLLFFLFPQLSISQNYPFTHFSDMPLMLCPASAGVSKNFRLAFAHRTSAGYYFSYDQNTHYKRGLGLFFLTNTTEDNDVLKQFEIDYNLKIKTSRFSRLSSGIGLNYTILSGISKETERTYNLSLSSTFYTRTFLSGLTVRNIVSPNKTSQYADLQNTTILFFSGWRYYFVKNRVIRRRKNANMQLLFAAFSNFSSYNLNAQTYLISNFLLIGGAYSYFYDIENNKRILSAICGIKTKNLTLKYSYNIENTTKTNFHEISAIYATKLSFDFHSDRKEFKYPLD